MPGYVPQPRHMTDLLYSRALTRGQQAMFLAALTGRSRCLLALEELRQQGHISSIEQPHPSAETRFVPLDRIVGSEGRCSDFDRDFNPLHDHNRGRWLHIAAARRRGTALPPVDLVQVEDLYFVQDGHHRISVARVLGQVEIEARVSVWHVSGPLPWETLARSSKQGLSRSFRLETLAGRFFRSALNYVRGLLPGQGDVTLVGGSEA